MGGVDARRRFVGEDDPGTIGERPRDGDALLLPHAQFGGLVVQTVAEPDGREQVGRPGPVGPSGAERHGHEDVFERGEARQEVELLEDEAEPVGPHAVADRFRERPDVGAADHHAPGVGPLNPRDDVEERGFARSAVSLERALRAGVEVKLGNVEDVDPLLPAGHRERLADVHEFDDWLLHHASEHASEPTLASARQSTACGG